MSTETDLEVLHSEKILRVIQSARVIDRHVDFYRWMQEEVHHFLPHDLVVAVWGDFGSGQLHYDVASAISDISTLNILKDSLSLDILVRDLYRKWLDSGRCWYSINNLDLHNFCRQDSSSCFAKLERMKSMLVHGVQNKRDKYDCLYVFFDRNPIIAEDGIVDLLLPQIDAALRRIECIETHASGVSGNARELVDDISNREHDVMNWVKIGKTNYEIGVILSISPNTVKNHIKRIFMKLDVSNRAQAVAKYDALNYRPINQY